MSGSESQSVSNQPLRISITLPTNAYFISGIRDFTLNLMRNMTEFSEQWAFRFQSVVDELCNNAIEYGSKPGDDITITFLHHPHESIEIFVEDRGSGSKKAHASDLNQIIRDRRDPNYVFTGIRGRGLAKIVAEWTDELEFSDRPEGGIKVRILKYLKNPGLQKEMEGIMSQPAHVVLN